MRPALRPRAAAPALWGAAAAWLALAAPAGAQQAGPPARACTLVLDAATDSTRSVRVQVEANRYVTYVGNGIRGTCGDARMNADSAVNYGGEQRVRMIGSVDYRDSVRTLTSDTLTYFQTEDRVLAVGNVVLVRRATGSRLTGPRVEFLRVGSAEERRTVATGRSHLTVRADTATAAGEGAAGDTVAGDTVAGEEAAGDTVAGDTVAGDTAAREEAAGDTATREGGSATEVDADRIVLLGERDVRTWGDVRIRRTRVDARADSAFFRLEEGRGRLMGSPRVDGESFTLTGDTIFTTFPEGELREVESVSEARATGEDFDLYAERIRARIGEDEIERLWAHGEGRSVAVSPPYRLAADSLDTAFAAGEMDTLYAVGAARAVEIAGEPAGDPREPIALTAGERSWITGDTLVFSFARRTAAAAGDTAVAAGDTAAAGNAVAAEGDPAAADTTAAAADDGTRLERVRAVGNARAYHVLEPDEGGERPARDYQLARVIEIFFVDGEVDRVVGQQAVGVHLDPMSGAERRGTEADTTGGGEGRP